MRLRDRLANTWLGFIDLISGGYIMAAQDKAWEWRCDAERKFYALREIAAMETPRANATVRRMAQVANEALK